jgi:SAM-dependent methyltransferase
MPSSTAPAVGPLSPSAQARSFCRFCHAPLAHVFADLGMSPLSNSYLGEGDLNRMEPFFPLRALVCEECFLVQLEQFDSAGASDIFSDYAYFSSYSTSWLKHAEDYVVYAIERFGLGPQSRVLEVASNDGYLLQYFVQRGIPVLGIEPAANVAPAAEEKGVETIVRFFGRELARELVADGIKADLIIGNNVLAHVPDLNDVVAGLKIVLAPGGVVTMEFPHLQRLVDNGQFDTIYHEHFSYFSFVSVQRVFRAHGLELYDVEELATHGGSIRIHARHVEDDSKPVSEPVHKLLARERALGYESLELYRSFAEQVKQEKREIVSFFVDAKERGLTIAGYGAPAKGNTLLNYCGIGTDFIDYTVDRSPHKQGLYLPGTHIPILEPEAIERTRPDLLVILPWNLRDEIMEQMSFVRDWGCRFVARSPKLRVFE